MSNRGEWERKGLVEGGRVGSEGRKRERRVEGADYRSQSEFSAVGGGGGGGGDQSIR